MRTGLLALLFVILASPAVAAPTCPPDNENFRAFYTDPAPFLAAIAKAESYPPSNEKLSGITVPHHLIADHLVALGFRAASGFRYKRVVILSPDHFFEAQKPFATATRGFDDVFGPVETDREAARKLLSAGDFVEESCLFARDHGVRAMLPFLRNYFPDARIVPVAISIKAGRADWDRMEAALEGIVDADTLVVQSTDFSHYLPHHEAKAFDQQTLNVLASGSLDQLAALRQPDHADSVGALYIQTKLQKRLFAAAPLVIANENQQQYASGIVPKTTSYMVILFGKFGPDFENPATGRENFTYFAGDTMFGRAMTRLLLDEAASERIESEILSRTRGRPLVVNLEGVLLPDVPQQLDHMTLGMPADLAIGWLKRLNVAGISLANNHAFDLGEAGYAETRAALSEAGIPAAGQGEMLTLPSLDVAALSDLGQNGPRAEAQVTPALLDRLAGSGDRPLVTFIHWGREYVAEPGMREKELADLLRLRAVSLVVGAHPHVASGAPMAHGGGDMLEIYSLGNFLFDQPAGRASGALLEVRTFEQGTFFARTMPLPNFFDLGRK